MYTDEEVTKDCRLAAHPLPLPAIDESEDIPPLTQTADGLDTETNQAPLDHPDYDEWGIYRGDEREPNKPSDEIYYSDNDDESPSNCTFAKDHQLLQKPSIEIDHSNWYNTPTITILHLEHELAKLSLALRQQIRLNQKKSSTISQLYSKLYFEHMLSEQQADMIKKLHCRCNELAYAKEHAIAYHENIATFNKCNETLLKTAGYLSTNNFSE